MHLLIYIMYGGILFLLEKEPRQTVNIAAKSWLIGKNAVEPRKMPAHRAHYKPYINHGEQCAHANDVPLPRAEEYVAEHHGKYHHGNVDSNFCLGKLYARNLAHCHRKAFAGHRYRTAAHLERNADAQYGAPGNLRNGFGKKICGNKPRCKPHVQVDKRAENETNHQLEQLHRLEFLAQHGYLPQNQHSVHYICVLPDC